MLEMLRMLQPGRPTIWRVKAWVGSRVPMKFRSNTISTPLSSRSKKVTVSSSRSAISKYSLSVLARALLPPAPFTRISQEPSSAITSSATCRQLALFMTLQV